MKHSSSWFRRIEITLWIIGISLLGFAAQATLARWSYQAQQERALFERGPAVSPIVVTPAPPRPAAATPDRPAKIQTAGAAEAPPAAVHNTSSADRDQVALSTHTAVAPRPVEKDRDEPPLDPAALGLIEIPRLGVFAVVREGADEDTLDRAVGLVPGTAHPGELGNIVLAGHRDTFFRPLRRIRLNDRIRLVVPPHTYEYRVESMRVVTEEETNVLESKGTEELTLVTCYPFRFIGPAPDRFIVSATRVN